MQQLINEISNEVKSTDALAISELYDKYAPALYGRILQVVKQKDIADKILEKVFIQAIDKSKFNTRRHLTPFTALLNQSRDKTYSTLKAIRVLKSLSCNYKNSPC